MSQDVNDINQKLSKILGLPKDCVRAVLTISAGKPPMIEVTTLMGTADHGATARFQLMLPASSGE